MSDVRVKVGADASQFNHIMSGVEHRLHGLKEFVGFGFKEQLASLVGAATIVEATKNMMEFAHATMTAAENMGITVQKALQLQAITRNHGTDLGLYAGPIASLPKMRADALRGQTKGDKKLANAFHALGISDKELQEGTDGGDFGMLKRMVISPPSSIGTPENHKAKLSGLFGGDAASKLLAQSGDLSHQEDFGVKTSSENIARLAEANVELQNFADMIKSVLIPVLLDFADFIKSKFQRVEDKVEKEKTTMNVMRYQAGLENKAPNKIVEKAAWALHGLGRGFGWVLNKVGLQTDKQVRDANEASYIGMATMLYGRKATNKGLASVDETEAEIKDRNEEFAKRAKERENKFKEEQRTLDQPAGVTATEVIAKAEKAFKNPLDHELKSNNPFLKIGGLMGTSDYRLERLQIKANSYLETIAKAAQQQMEHDYDNSDPDPYTN